MIEDSTPGFNALSELSIDTERRQCPGGTRSGRRRLLCPACRCRDAAPRALTIGRFLEALHHHLAIAAEALRKMERRVEAIQAVEQGNRLRDVLRPSGLGQFFGTCSSDVCRSGRAIQLTIRIAGSTHPIAATTQTAVCSTPEFASRTACATVDPSSDHTNGSKALVPKNLRDRHDGNARLSAARGLRAP